MHIAIVPNLVIFYRTIHNILIGCFGIDVDKILNMLQKDTPIAIQDFDVVGQGGHVHQRQLARRD